MSSSEIGGSPVGGAEPREVVDQLAEDPLVGLAHVAARLLVVLGRLHRQREHVRRERLDALVGVHVPDEARRRDLPRAPRAG